MLLSLRDAFTALLRDAYPTVFGGSDPPVQAEFQAEEWTWDASSADATAGEPAQDDARDVLAFDPDDPEGPYTLSRPPYPGPRRVYLRAPDGGRITLGPDEVRWDPADARDFTLHPKPVRVLEGFDAVEVLYGVTAVFTKLKSVHQVVLAFTGEDEALLERGEVLALAAFALNREGVMRDGAFSQSGGDYQARGEVKSLALRRGIAGPGTRTLVMDAEVELKVSRALAEDEGRPIERILTPGGAPGARRVDVRIDVQA